MKIDPTSVARIVIARNGKIGDMILTNFAIRKIRRAFPRASILLSTLPRNKELLRYSKDVDRIRYFHKGLDILPLLLTIRSFRPDILFDFNDNPSTTSALLARFCGAGTIVGFAFESNRRFLTVPVECPPKELTHITERLRKIPEAIGITFQESEIVPSMTIGERELAEASSQMKRMHDGRIIAVNISAGHSSRYWSVESWSKVLQSIRKQDNDVRFLLLSIPRDMPIRMEIVQSLPPANVILPASDSFQHFAAYISRSDMLISPDTSAVHIAGAFNVPVLGLYPAVEWNHTSWHPIGTEYETVRPDIGVVSDIQVNGVLAAYARLMAKVTMGKFPLESKA